MPQRSKYRGDSGKKEIMSRAGKIIAIEKAMGKRQETEDCSAKENPNESQ